MHTSTVTLSARQEIAMQSLSIHGPLDSIQVKCKIAITSSTRVGDELLLPANSLKIMNEDTVITQEGGVTRY